MQNKSSKGILIAFEKGYRIVKGNISYHGKLWVGNIDKQGYYTFTIGSGRKARKIRVHRLLAYQKFGEVIFVKGVQVRHKNDNKLDNSDDNIVLGTQSQNMMDMPKEKRQRIAIYASSFIKKHKHEEILRLHKEGYSYLKIMK